eukprot:2209514-Prymnesium_polylepis.1
MMTSRHRPRPTPPIATPPSPSRAQGMTSVGAKLVAQLLVADGESPLPLRRLVFHGNQIGPDGFSAVGEAIRHERCAAAAIRLEAVAAFPKAAAAFPKRAARADR